MVETLLIRDFFLYVCIYICVCNFSNVFDVHSNFSRDTFRETKPVSTFPRLFEQWMILFR